jgi:hypothetical protein
LKMKRLLSILLICLILCGSLTAQKLPELEKVKEIKMLVSTREDVRRILADYNLKDSEQTFGDDTFETNNFNISVSYSEGKCQSEAVEPTGFDIEEGKVVQLEFTPKRTIKLNEVGLNFSKFKKENQYTNFKAPKIYYRKDIGMLILTLNDEIDEIIFEPSKSHYSELCDQGLANRLLSTSSYFDPKQKERYYHFGDAIFPVNVINLILNKLEVLANIDDKTIAILTVVENPVNDPLVFNYTVNGGKVLKFGEKPIDRSNKVMWDLSGVKPGTYTITAAVDNGCGFCGKTMTKTVTVKECEDCVNP